MNRELLSQVVLLKQKVTDMRSMSSMQMMQKATRAEAIIEEAVFVIEKLVEHQSNLKNELRSLSDDLALDMNHSNGGLPE